MPEDKRNVHADFRQSDKRIPESNIHRNAPLIQSMGGIGGPGMRGFGRRGPQGPHARFMGPREKPKNLGKTLVRLSRYLRDDIPGLIVVILAVLLNTACTLIGPLLIGQAIDQYIIPGDFQGLVRISLLLLGVYILNSLVAFLQGFFMASVSEKTVARIRRDLFSKYQVLPLKFFDSHTHGELMSRLTNDIDTISITLHASLTQFISGVIVLVGTIILMLLKSVILTLITLSIIPLMFLLTQLITKHTGRLFIEQQKTLGELNGKIEETISGQRVVKLFCREQHAIAEFEESNQKLKKTALKAQVLSRVMGPTMNLLNNLGFALVAGIGGLLAVNNIGGAVTVGTISIFLNYSRQFTRPLNEMANQYNMVLSAAAGAERVFQVLDEEPEPGDAPDAVDLRETGVKGHVEFENVSFAYDDENLVLRNFSLEVKPGQTVALVGETGAGKTTIINLLTRFYDVKEGSIRIDGIDIRKIKRESLRSCLGIVLQDTYLFNATVRENIRYGRLDATDEEVEQAAKIAHAHDFIMRLPQGYDTILTDEGGNLSHGQRQLLAIARAVLADPAILILDEATSSVDTRTEVYIQKAMRNLMKGRTSFVIAHRLSTIKDADLIAVIDKGRLVEKGTHQELLERKGVYYNLYQSQFVRTRQAMDENVRAASLS
ncbi:ATP-binding cassette subfamily B protein [Caldicoprobacter guelmensis]|nr:ABC transporter ATP-binding protein [Caldicoprobacter guelmensis]MBM7583214.1 ATP-binding cassette subfamily B protein [Caldicoprobacter guelmensis]